MKQIIAPEINRTIIKLIEFPELSLKEIIFRVVLSVKFGIYFMIDVFETVLGAIKRSSRRNGIKKAATEQPSR